MCAYHAEFFLHHEGESIALKSSVSVLFIYILYQRNSTLLRIRKRTNHITIRKTLSTLLHMKTLNEKKWPERRNTKVFP